MLYATTMCRKCGMLDISEQDEEDVQRGSSVGFFAGRSHRGWPVVRELDTRRIYHGPDAVGCECDPLLTIPVYLG